MKVSKMLGIAVLALASNLAIAAPDSKVKVPKQIKAGIDSGGVTLESSFPVGDALNGLVLKTNNRYDIVYTTKDGKYVIVGNLFDEAGKKLSQVHAERYIPKPDYTKLYNQLEKSTYIQEGSDNANAVYVFFDVNCVFCHYIWKASQAYIKAGATIRWVPVAILRQDSLTKAAAILEADNPLAVFAEQSSKFSTGGIKGKVDVSGSTRNKLDANKNLMSDFGLGGTPAVLYKDAQGKVRIVEGMPKLGKFPEIFKVPEQEINDPELAKFK